MTKLFFGEGVQQRGGAGVQQRGEAGVQQRGGAGVQQRGEADVQQRGEAGVQQRGGAEDGKPKKPYPSIFRRVANWQNLWFYQKSEVLYQMTVVFCDRFLPKHGDRTVDQMVQAARSCKQNIVEGSEDGKTSTEMELKLLNVARSSIGELRQDFEDYLKSRHLRLWTPADERFQPMQDYTRQHNQLAEYEPYFTEWTAEEMCNVAISLCFQVDTMMNKYMEGLEQTFVTEGGIKERMHKARTGFRQQQDARLTELETAVPQLLQQLAETQTSTEQWKAAYQDLKQRALNAYYRQEQDIKGLKEEVERLKGRL